MNVQEVLVFLLVGLAAVYTAYRFIRQFTQRKSTAGSCSKCSLAQAVEAAPAKEVVAEKSDL